MADPPTRPGSTPQSEADRDARQAREAAALRENLRRRKEQQRNRTEKPPSGSPTPQTLPD